MCVTHSTVRVRACVREITAVCSDADTKQTNAHCGQNVELQVYKRVLLNVQLDATVF